MSKRVLVVGASGFVGSELVRLLKRAEHEVKSVSSRQSVDPDVLTIDLTRGADLEAAFEGVDAAFLMAPPGKSDQHTLLSPQIRVASRKRLGTVVMLSAPGAGSERETPFRRAEIELEATDLDYTILRPNWFMQNFNSYWLGQINGDGRMRLPAGGARASFIDTRDIAAATAVLLTSGGGGRRTLDLTGPEALDHHQVAYELSAVIGRKIAYEDVSPSEFAAQLSDAGVAPANVAYLNGIFAELKQGRREPVSLSFEEVVGRAPRRFADYAQDHRHHWK